MKIRAKSVALAAALLLAGAPLAIGQNEGQGQGRATVTVLPSNGKAATAVVPEHAVHVWVDGHKVAVNTWRSSRGSRTPVEVVLMIDNGARQSLGRELNDIRHFLESLPPNAKVTLAYMEYGRAALAGPLTADHGKAVKELHLPVGAPGMNASPYFCLSDLAKHWPSNDQSARREVIMITDGVDNYQPHYNPEDPYVLSAIHDAVRAHLLVYSIYWRNTGMLSSSGYETNAGQNLLAEVTQATGGYSYWIGYGNPVSLTPYFDDFNKRLENQYELGFLAPLRGKSQVESLKVRITARNVKTTAPQKTYVVPAAGDRE